MEGTVSEETQDSIKAGLVRTQMEGTVSEETQDSIKAGLVRTQIEGTGLPRSPERPSTLRLGCHLSNDMSRALLHARARFDRMLLEINSSGALQKSALFELATWLWDCFNPGGVPLSPSERSQHKAKLASWLDLNGSGMEFDEFSTWFKSSWKAVLSSREQEPTAPKSTALQAQPDEPMEHMSQQTFKGDSTRPAPEALVEALGSDRVITRPSPPESETHEIRMRASESTRHLTHVLDGIVSIDVSSSVKQEDEFVVTEPALDQIESNQDGCIDETERVHGQGAVDAFEGEASEGKSTHSQMRAPNSPSPQSEEDKVVMYLSDSMEDNEDKIQSQTTPEPAEGSAQEHLSRVLDGVVTIDTTSSANQDLEIVVPADDSDVKTKELIKLQETLEKAQSEEAAAMEKVQAARKLREETMNKIYQLTPRRDNVELPQAEPEPTPTDPEPLPEKEISTRPLSEVLEGANDEFQRLDLDDSGVLETRDLMSVAKWVCARVDGGNPKGLSDEQVEMIETSIDEHDGLMDFGEFSEQMGKLFEQPMSPKILSGLTAALWDQQSPGAPQTAEPACQGLDSPQDTEESGSEPVQRTPAQWADWIMNQADRHKRNGELTVNELLTFLPKHEFTTWLLEERSRLLRYDTNRDGAISLPELQRACEDYFSGMVENKEVYSESDLDDDHESIGCQISAEAHRSMPPGEHDGRPRAHIRALAEFDGELVKSLIPDPNLGSLQAVMCEQEFAPAIEMLYTVYQLNNQKDGLSVSQFLQLMADSKLTPSLLSLDDQTRGFSLFATALGRSLDAVDSRHLVDQVFSSCFGSQWNRSMCISMHHLLLALVAMACDRESDIDRSSQDWADTAIARDALRLLLRQSILPLAKSGSAGLMASAYARIDELAVVALLEENWTLLQSIFYYYGRPNPKLEQRPLEKSKAGHIDTLGLTLRMSEVSKVLSKTSIVPELLSQEDLEQVLEEMIGAAVEPRQTDVLTWSDWLRLLRACVERTSEADPATRVGHLISRLACHHEMNIAVHQLWQRRLIGFHQALKKHIAVPETTKLLGHLWCFFSLPRKNDYNLRVISSTPVPAPGISPRSHWQASPGSAQKPWKSFVAPLVATESAFDGVMPLRGLRALCAKLMLPEGAISPAEITQIAMAVTRPGIKPVLSWDGFLSVLASVARVVFGGADCCALSAFDKLLTEHLLPVACSCVDLPDDPTHPRAIAAASSKSSTPAIPSSPPCSWAKLPGWAVAQFERHQECAVMGLDDIISHYVGHPDQSFSLQQLHALLDDAQLLSFAAGDVEALLIAHGTEGQSKFFTVSRRDFARLLARVAQKMSLADNVLPAEALWMIMSQHLAPLVKYVVEDPIADRLDNHPLAMF